MPRHLQKFYTVGDPIQEKNIRHCFTTLGIIDRKDRSIIIEIPIRPVLIRNQPYKGKNNRDCVRERFQRLPYDDALFPRFARCESRFRRESR